jgi:hypothetical protein
MNKNYCIDCKYFEQANPISESKCNAQANLRMLNNPIKKEYEPIQPATIKNQNNDCKDFRSKVERKRNFAIWAEFLFKTIKKNPEYLIYGFMGVIVLTILIALMSPVGKLLARYAGG